MEPCPGCSIIICLTVLQIKLSYSINGLCTLILWSLGLIVGILLHSGGIPWSWSTSVKWSTAPKVSKGYYSRRPKHWMHGEEHAFQMGVLAGLHVSCFWYGNHKNLIPGTKGLLFLKNQCLQSSIIVQKPGWAFNQSWAMMLSAVPICRCRESLRFTIYM